MTGTPPPSADYIFYTFKEVSDHLERIGIRHWIDFGTLLGAVRSGSFIECDQDVDFNFFQEDLHRFLGLAELFRHQWKLELLFEPSVNTVRLLPHHPGLNLSSDYAAHRSCIEAKLPYADFYPCRTDGKWIRHPVVQYDCRTVYSRRIIRLPFEGWAFPAPQNPRSLLRHRYGADWSHPLGREDFDHLASRLVEPSPDVLRCLLLASADSSSGMIIDEALTLGEDFDQVVVEWSNQRCAMQSTELREMSPRIEFVSSLGVKVEYSDLISSGCHFVKTLGSHDVIAPRIGHSLMVSDVILHSDNTNE